MSRRGASFDEVLEVSAAYIAHSPAALGAFATGNHPRSYHVVALLNLRAAGTYLLHDSGALVACGHGQRHLDLAQ